MPIFTQEQLNRISTEIFEAASVPPEEAQIISELLVDANLVGHDSHGVIRIPQYIKRLRNGDIQPGAPMEIERESPSHAVINGNWGFGQVIAKKAMSLAIRKAQSSVISAVSIYDCNHIGRLASYTMMAADHGLIGITMLNAGGAALSVAAFGGIDRRLGTNPISVAVPDGEADSIVLDITSSVVAQGKIDVAVNRGDSVPLGWLIDGKGEPTTDPQDFDNPSPGSILPLGGLAGHKGFGLGLIIDVLAGTLSGSGCSGSNNARVCNATLMIVIDIAKFIPLEDYDRHIDKLVTFMKCSQLAPGFDEVLMPGEIESRQKQQRLSEGIPVDDETWRQIQETAANVGISQLNY